jgi:Ca2+-binding RTX toxin-like protein
MWKRMLRIAHNRRPSRRRPSRRTLLADLTGIESLDLRIVLAVTAVVSAAQGVLPVTGDAQDNTITVSRDALGTILINNGAITVQGGTPTTANTRLIQISGLGGNDNLSLDETNGSLPAANIDGDDGNDVLSGGSGNDVLTGGAGNDTFRFDTGNDLGSQTIDESGGGVDTLDFSATTTRAVSIDLGNPAAQVVNDGLTLTLSAGNTIENVIGGAHSASRCQP